MNAVCDRTASPPMLWPITLSVIAPFGAAGRASTTEVLLSQFTVTFAAATALNAKSACASSRIIVAVHRDVRRSHCAECKIRVRFLARMHCQGRRVRDIRGAGIIDRSVRDWGLGLAGAHSPRFRIPGSPCCRSEEGRVG